MSLDYTQLGPVTLSPHLLLSGLESRAMVAYSVLQTIGGKGYVMGDSVDQATGQELSLQGTNHFTLDQIRALQALAGQQVLLTHHRGTFQVLITATPDEPAVAHADPEGADWYSGTIDMVLLEIVELTL